MRPLPQVRPRQVLLTTIPSDAHMWNLVFLQLLLEEKGCNVVNLGQCTPIDLVRDTALAMRPDLIVVSTVNGHGHLDSVRLVTELRRHPELADVTVVIGGKLGISGADNVRYAGQLIDAGFDAVFEADTDAAATDRLVELVAPRPVLGTRK
ncbi:MAG TPA: cobalamin-dependent protein [Pseudonocardiaceae bacterium]|nr:cobalamin-dependent protein [Pseudonocardiaceae bacterium]